MNYIIFGNDIYVLRINVIIFWCKKNNSQTPFNYRQQDAFLVTPCGYDGCDYCRGNEYSNPRLRVMHYFSILFSTSWPWVTKRISCCLYNLHLRNLLYNLIREKSIRLLILSVSLQHQIQEPLRSQKGGVDL